jgi:hypothetical protein
LDSLQDRLTRHHNQTNVAAQGAYCDCMAISSQSRARRYLPPEHCGYAQVPRSIR